MEDRRRDRIRDAPRPRMTTFFVPGEGIDREVITIDICRYLGNDAILRPGTYQDPKTGESRAGYFITAYRALTTLQLADLKADSLRWQVERARLPTASSSRAKDGSVATYTPQEYRHPKSTDPYSYRYSKTSRQRLEPVLDQYENTVFNRHRGQTIVSQSYSGYPGVPGAGYEQTIGSSSKLTPSRYPLREPIDENPAESTSDNPDLRREPLKNNGTEVLAPEVPFAASESLDVKRKSLTPDELPLQEQIPQQERFTTQIPDSVETSEQALAPVPPQPVHIRPPSTYFEVAEPGAISQHSQPCRMCNILSGAMVSTVASGTAVGFWRSVATGDEGRGFTDAAFVVAAGGALAYSAHIRHAPRCRRRSSVPIPEI